MTATIEVAIADKNPVVRAGLENLIQRDGRFQISGLYANGGALLV